MPATLLVGDALVSHEERRSSGVRAPRGAAQVAEMNHLAELRRTFAELRRTFARGRDAAPGEALVSHE